MATNLETRNNLERDEIMESLDDLKGETEGSIDKKLSLEIDSTFDSFYQKSKMLMNPINQGLLNSSDAKESGLSMKKMKNGKIMLNSYGESCLLDVKMGEFWFLKGNTRISLDELTGVGMRDSLKEWLSGKTDERRFRFYLFQAFGQMHIINRAISISKKHLNNKKFYFEDGNMLDKLDPTEDKDRILKIDGEGVVSQGVLKNAGIGRREKEILSILNKIVK